jgi:hypothetical protein
MLRKLLPITALAALWAGSALGQTAPPRTAEPVKPGVAPVPAADGSRAYRVKQVLGAKVSLKGDLSIGTVDDVVFSDAGAVEYLIVANEGKLVTVPWEAAKFDFDKRIATIDITQEQYREIPTYTVREYPVYFEPTYRTQVYGWFGLKPRAWTPLRR